MINCHSWSSIWVWHVQKWKGLLSRNAWRCLVLGGYRYPLCVWLFSATHAVAFPKCKRWKAYFVIHRHTTSWYKQRWCSGVSRAFYLGTELWIWKMSLRALSYSQPSSSKRITLKIRDLCKRARVFWGRVFRSMWVLCHVQCSTLVCFCIARIWYIFHDIWYLYMIFD
jgi:hypothetical protein